MFSPMLLSMFFVFASAFITEPPYLLGTYILRKTNDVRIKSKFTYLILNNENNIKLKSINQNFIAATKVSRTGVIELNNCFKTSYNLPYYLRKFMSLGKFKSENDMHVYVNFNNVNKYSYSLFGIEIPEFRYKQIANYNIKRVLRIKQKDYCLYITDEYDNYYLFDLITAFYAKDLPYVETPMNTLIVTNIISFIINLALVKFLDII